jgi:CBS domain containing-hemolysin-like protein
MILTGVILCASLLCVTAFFSAAETALLTLPPQELKRIALRYPSLEPHVRLWMAEPQKLIITILVGNTLTDIAFTSGFAWIILTTLTGLPRRGAEGLAWLAGTLITMLLGEIFPKLLGRRRPDICSRLAFPVLWFFGILFKPLLVVLEKALNLFLAARVSGPRPLTFSPDELLAMLAGSHRELQLSPECLYMMKRTLEINKKLSRDIMTPAERVEYLNLDRITGHGADAVELFIERGHTRVPIVKDDELFGYLHAKDILDIVVKDHSNSLKLLRMIRPLISVDGNKPVAELLIDFEVKELGMVRVLGSGRSTLGIITLEDILEEITGEILDEYDT